MTFTVVAVGPDPKMFNGQYGPMASYRVKFKEAPDEVVEVVQKTSTPEPKRGDVMDGTIDRTGQYGPKFKKEFTPKVGGGAFGGGKSDPRAFYVSYAKDLIAALIAGGVKPSAKDFATEYDIALGYINEGAERLEKNQTSAQGRVDPELESLKDTFGEVEPIEEGFDDLPS